MRFLDHIPETLEEYLAVVHSKNYFSLDDDLDELVVSLFLWLETDFKNNIADTMAEDGKAPIVNDIELIGDSVLLHLYHPNYQHTVAHQHNVVNKDILPTFKKLVSKKFTVI